jgi:N-acetylmuramic acid 6-phosphate (MurNAc-6-P) etherase
MNLKNTAKAKINTNKVVTALIIATGKSYPTIKRWITHENEKITDSIQCMNIITELTGLTADQIVESRKAVSA